MALVDALAEQIVSSDRFLDLPKSTRLFYYHLCATARDGGFVRGVRAQMAVCGADERDLILLTGGKYLSRTEDGYYRITHWSDNQRNTMTYKIWREAVLDRDVYKCCACGSRENLHAHHIKPFAEYPDKRFDVRNGITLCDKCHRAIHKMMHEDKIRKEVQKASGNV